MPWELLAGTSHMTAGRVDRGRPDSGQPDRGLYWLCGADLS